MWWDKLFRGAQAPRLHCLAPSPNKLLVSIQELAGIENVVWIQRSFKYAVYFPGDVAGRCWPPSFLGQSNPVLTGNHAAPGEYMRKKLVERVLNLFSHC